MKLPHQAPPIPRSTQQTGRSSQPFPGSEVAAATSEYCAGIEPSGLNDCYRLPGLAQQLCLMSY